MSKKRATASPRGRRDYPQEERIFSTNFLPQMLGYKEKCFVPLADFQKLQKKYLKMFKRYRRALNSG